jgi:LmbE family N-acetylglucosaminyl deacetylase
MGRVTDTAVTVQNRRTLVFFHAHPDDEASQTSGTMARAVAAGHRVVVVYATNGDQGEAPEDLAAGETVADRRRAEADRSARVLGTARVQWLGYADSGMTGWEQNGAPDAFCNADRDQAASRLAAILDSENADVLVCYDWHGGYGHPDHIQVHRVGHRAAELAVRRPRVLEATMNRDAMRRLREYALASMEQAVNQAIPAQAAATGQAGEAADADQMDFDPDAPMDDGNPMGTPEAEIHWQVDVSEFLDRKRQALQAHASQVTDIGFFLGMPPEVFAAAFGTEYFIEPGSPPGMRSGWLLDAPGTDSAGVRKDRSMTTASGAGASGMEATP